MNIIVFGATGRSGKQIVRQALDAGYKVKAVARDPSSITIKHNNLSVIKGDVLQPETFTDNMQNVQVVFSALGSRDRKPTIMFSEGMHNIIAAMQAYSVKRIMCISASGIETSPKLNFFLRMATKVLQRVLKNPFGDMLRMEQLLKQSNLNWTIVRPPRLTNGELKNKYRFAVNEWLANCTIISRADLAHFMLQHANDSNTYRSITEVAY